MGGPVTSVPTSAEGLSFEDAVAQLRKQYETKPEEPINEGATPPLKILLHAIVNHLSLTTADKQRFYDLVQAEYGRHADDPLRPGHVAVNVSPPVG